MLNYDLAIRADGNSSIGTGHIHRTLALASYLKCHFNITFYACNSDTLVEELITKNGFSFIKLNAENEFLKQINKTTIVVLDGYDFNTSYQQVIKYNTNKLVVIDDLNQGVQIADVVLNHGYTTSPNDYKLSENTALYTGLPYVILKQEFLNQSSHSPKKNSKKVLVCIGGTDPNNYSEKIISELLDKTTKDISLITYPINPNFEKLKQIADKNKKRLHLHFSLSTEEMIKLISVNDIAILQPSNIALEAASLGIYINLIQTADNQKYIHGTLLKTKCAADINLETLAYCINSISIDQINSQIDKQKNIFDKKSPERILSIFNSLFLKVRCASENDADLIFKWSNDKLTRENSYSQSEIDHASHVNWFHQKLNDNTCCFLIIEFEGVPAGTVRFDIKEDETVVGINVSPEFRRKKLSTAMLRLSCQYLFNHFKETSITAYIKKSNSASLKSFANSGFEIIDLKIYFGAESYRLIKKK